MRGLYDAEQLAYEVWKCMAVLRIMGKGASLQVEGESPFFFDNRSDDLNKLIAIYDERQREPGASATGTVFDKAPVPGESSGYVLLPTYNVGRTEASVFTKWFELLGLTLKEIEGINYKTNFIWFPFNIRGYYFAHEPFWKGFEDRHHLPFSWLISSVAALAQRVFYIWREQPQQLIHYWQRAYEGPTKYEYIKHELRVFLPIGMATIGAATDPSQVDVDLVLDYLKLNADPRKNIDIGLGGPHSVLLPFGSDRYFI